MTHFQKGLRSSLFLSLLSFFVCFDEVPNLDPRFGYVLQQAAKMLCWVGYALRASTLDYG